MNVEKSDIINYLKEVKAAILAGNYKVEMNERRQDNIQLFFTYVISEEKQKEILLSLEADDFVEITPNEHKGYEHENLYVFGKEVQLLQRFGTDVENVPLYLKFNKLRRGFVIVISFHKQRYPLTYLFK